MPWTVSRDSRCPVAKPFGVVKEADGSLVACHESRSKARAQQAALYASEAVKSLGYVPLALKANFDLNEPRDEQGRWTDSGEDPLALAQSAFKQATLSIKENAATTVYGQLHHFEQINGALRAGEKGPRAVIDGLDSAIQKSITKRDLTLWRGVDGRLKLKPGDRVSDLAFQSTSLDRQVANDFSTDAGTLMEIRLPAGSHALSVDLGSRTVGESEVILPRASSFIVKKASANHVILEPVT